jgi:hypothetical protein
MLPTWYSVVSLLMNSRLATPAVVRRCMSGLSRARGRQFALERMGSS